MRQLVFYLATLFLENLGGESELWGLELWSEVCGETLKGKGSKGLFQNLPGGGKQETCIALEDGAESKAVRSERRQDRPR